MKGLLDPGSETDTGDHPTEGTRLLRISRSLGVCKVPGISIQF